ncbi:ABC transporter ATP-binding protein [Kibdelosporangium philippinense]|uniref:ABC transporter ATP-binding protein n=1 Tax=Kibdelosporangium philippinense TaxID=211113 RepID=A0ABS8ZWX0_9PSEU|nr:ABC transporter ATP-binding protein [Kibdelosporangium philippinense]MCE7012164.1 ABC transporter ATP-binding protein [Kibdelosporangium philippinense]
MTGLIVKGLVAGYDEPVLRGLDLVVPEGALVAVLGPSGCGKTTLLRVVAGLHAPVSGRIELNGRDLAGIPPERRGIGIVPQEGALFPHLNVTKNVAFGLDRDDRRNGRVSELLDLVGLGDFGNRMPSELSGGQQQRVALARALAPKPGVILMDEPFSSLDAGLRDELRSDVRAALRATGATALLVTHDQEEALGIADLVAVLRAGVVAQLGTPQEIYASPANLGVALFVGEAVTFPATVIRGSVDTPLGRFEVKGQGEGKVLIRPEQLSLGTGIEATVVDVRFHGHDATVLLRLRDGTRVRSRVLGTHLKPGENTAVTVRGPVLFFPGKGP